MLLLSELTLSSFWRLCRCRSCRDMRTPEVSEIILEMRLLKTFVTDTSDLVFGRATLGTAIAIATSESEYPFLRRYPAEQFYGILVAGNEPFALDSAKKCPGNIS
ncbi:hypothetical protein FPV67DRAFT_1508545 [Lyophyllum atratum]|nr:hypothetical protein FPV67DRAFT_1508545 [Lyophyllum atratum]